MEIGTILSLVGFGLMCILAIIIISKEIFNLRDFNYTFRCEHCNNKLQEISYSTICDKCHRHIKGVTKHWDHYLTFRTSRIDTKRSRGNFKYNKYLTPFKIELTVDIFCLIILISIILIIILEVQ